jgi:hypothetical protein
MVKCRNYLGEILCYVIVFLFTHVLTVCCTSFVIESNRQSDNYHVILFQSLGIFFVTSSVSFLFQQYITKIFIRNTGLFDNKVITFCYFHVEFALFFLFVFYPIPCLLIIYGINSYWVLSMIFVVWEIFLITAIVIYKQNYHESYDKI